MHCDARGDRERRRLVSAQGSRCSHNAWDAVTGVRAHPVYPARPRHAYLDDCELRLVDEHGNWDICLSFLRRPNSNEGEMGIVLGENDRQ